MMFLILALYMTIVVGSFTRVWGVDYTPDWRHYATAMTRGLEAFMDTTFPNLDTVSFTYMRSAADCVLRAHPRPS